MKWEGEKVKHERKTGKQIDLEENFLVRSEERNFPVGGGFVRKLLH